MRNSVCMTIAILITVSWASSVSAESIKERFFRMRIRQQSFATAARDSFVSLREEAKDWLAMELQYIDQSTPLSQSQLTKLEVAGTGDIEALFNDAEPVIKHAITLEWGSPEAQQVVTSILSLERKVLKLFGPDSLLQKTRRNLGLQPPVRRPKESAG